jgi:hypothetical protein
LVDRLIVVAPWRWRFAAPEGGPVEVSYPFILRSRSDQ